MNKVVMRTDLSHSDRATATTPVAVELGSMTFH